MRCYLYMAVEQLGFRKKDRFYHAHFITQGLVQDKPEWRERGKFISRRQALWETSPSRYSGELIEMANLLLMWTCLRCTSA